MRKIYFAAPLHDPADQARNARAVELLRKQGYEVYLPQEHGVWEDLLSRFNNDAKATRMHLYKMDLHAMQQADCCVAYVDRDKGPSEGMLWEMGYMTGDHKPVFLVNPLRRHRYNLMPEFGSMQFGSLEELLLHLEREDFK